MRNEPQRPSGWYSVGVPSSPPPQPTCYFACFRWQYSATSVLSADRVSTTATKLLKGTSQAGAHATGVYAALKAANPSGISVADATAWIITTGSIAVTYTLPAPVNTQTYRRIRIPNL